MRTLTLVPTTVERHAAVLHACPPPSAGFARETTVFFARSVDAAVAQGTNVLTAPPRTGVPATGVGYVGRPDAGAWRKGREVLNAAAAIALGKRATGTASTKQIKQQDQLHLMSRRDPRTWRPPA